MIIIIIRQLNNRLFSLFLCPNFSCLSTSQLSFNKPYTKGSMFIGVWADSTENAEDYRDCADATLPGSTKDFSVDATIVKPIRHRKTSGKSLALTAADLAWSRGHNAGLGVKVGLANITGTSALLLAVKIRAGPANASWKVSDGARQST